MSFKPKNDGRFDVAIIGGGFSGVAVAFHLAKKSQKTGLRISCVMFEPREAVGAGVAYQTTSAVHLLNVPAFKMSLDESDPDSFVRWLHENSYNYQPNDFVPRHLYQAYLVAMLTGIDKGESEFTLEIIKDKIVSIDSTADTYHVLRTEDGRQVQAKSAILAVGNSPDGASTSQTESALQSPWNAKQINEALFCDDIAVIGTGLSAIDTILALEQKAFKGRYTIISRRGLLPQPHAAHHAADKKADAAALRINAILSLSQMIREFRQAVDEGSDWRSLFEALRPYTQSLWGRLPARRKRSFIRHLRPYWDSHRHRVPEESLEVVTTLMKRDRLKLMQGNVLSHQNKDKRIELSIRDKKGRAVVSFDQVFDCRGIWVDLRKSQGSLLDSIIKSGAAAYDDLALGLRTHSNGQLVPAQGLKESRLYTLGSLRRGELWETTAVREIRSQAKTIAETIVPELAQSLAQNS